MISKKIRILAWFLAVTVAGLGIYPIQLKAAVLPLSATSAILLDSQTNRVIYSKSPNLKRAPASTTKILTAMVVKENISLDKVVSISSRVENVEPTKIFLKGGEKFYVRDLVRAILIKSANDAAEALAIAVSGSRAGFAKLMNQKVKDLGARRSRFVNPNGLPAKNQYSTVSDMVKIMKAANKYPFIGTTLKIKGITIKSLGGRSVFLKNHNKMLWKSAREVIGKTGWTRKAKHCFLGSISAPTKKVLVAMLGSKSPWNDLKKLAQFPSSRIMIQIRQNRKLWARHDIIQIQTALKRAGHSPGSIDGVFGRKTLMAVERFQRANGLSADGIVGSRTWKKLKNYL